MYGFSALIFLMIVGCQAKGPVSSSLPTPTLVKNCRVSDEQTRNALAIESDVVIGVGFFTTCYGSSGEPLRIGVVQSSAILYPSISYSILNEIVVGPATIDITLLSIQEPQVTADQIGPAETISLFEIPNGEYSLNLIHGSQTDKYKLLVADTGVSLSALSMSFTALGENFASAN